MVPFDHPGVSRLHRFGRRSSRWSSSPTTPPASPSASRGQPHGLADDRRHPRRPRVPHTPTSPSVPSQRLSQLVEPRAASLAAIERRLAALDSGADRPTL